MEEDYMNANFTFYKYRFVLVIIVALLVYYLMKQYEMNTRLIAAVVVGALVYYGIYMYAKSKMEQHVAMMNQYSAYIGGNGCMAQEYPVGNENEINIEQVQARSALARSADASINAGVYGNYVQSVNDLMKDSRANVNNPDIDLPKGNVSFRVTPYKLSPVTIEQQMQAQSMVQRPVAEFYMD